MLTLHTFGDSLLASARFNDRGITAGQLLVRNDDALFPDLQGRDLQALGPARLAHHAADGATVADLPGQARDVDTQAPALALLTIGGNDLMRGLAADESGVPRFADRLESFLESLPIRPVLLGNVYDPTFGDDDQNFLDVPARRARANLRRVNAVLAAAAARHGQLVDLHTHFLRGQPGWFTRIFEPSLEGTSQIRRAFLPAVLAAARRA